MNTALLSIKNISKTFPGVKALSGVSLDILQNEVHVLAGENGAGKSTFIKILSGVYTPDEGGKIFLEGKEVKFSDPMQAIQQGIAVVYQDLSLFDNLSILENISLAYRYQQHSWKRWLVHWKSMRSLAKEAMLKIKSNLPLETLVGDLSMGQKQMVAIARALVGSPKVIIMDEPTASLSQEETEILLGIVADLKKQGVSIIYISHKLEELAEIGDRFTVIRDGQVINTWVAGKVSEDQLIHAMVGRDVTLTHIDRGTPLGSVVLSVSNLSKKYNFKDISFEVRSGEILGFSGIVGAGRTEVMEAIYGVTRFDQGTVTMEGKNVAFRAPSEAILHKIAYVPEDRKGCGLVLPKSISENINMIANSFHHRYGFLDTSWMNFNTAQWIGQLDIRPNIPDMLTNLQSGGNQQKVVLSKCLTLSPKLLIIDEPTNGIDIGSKSNIHNLLRQLADEGLAVIVVSSDLVEVLAVCDRVIVMKKGRITADLPNNGLHQADVMKYAL